MTDCRLWGIPPHQHPALDLEGEVGELGPLAAFQFDRIIFEAAKKFRLTQLRVATMGARDPMVVAAQAAALAYAEG